MDGYCLGCGKIYDVRVMVACPRCQSCPECGKRQKVPAATCTCGHPSDEAKLSELEARLDPERPSNRRDISRFENEAQNHVAWNRIRKWRLLGVAAVVLPALMIGVFKVQAQLGILQGPTVAMAIASLFLPLVIFLVRRGKLPWLVKAGDESNLAP